MSVRRLLWLVGFVFLGSFLSATNPPPTLSSMSPVVGSTNGGTAVTLSGSNFVAGATVTVAGVPATGVVVASGNTITAVAPANPAGPANVTVTNPDGQSSTLAVVLSPLSNAGFESGSSGWIWNSSGAATIITNSAQAHSGNNFLQLTSQPTNLPSYGAILGTGSSWSSQFLAVNPGDKITFGGWIARVSGDGFARWTIAVADANQANSTYVSTANATASAWTLVQATYTIPAGKAFIRFYAEVYNNTIPAQSNFDDAILQRQLAVGGYTYLSPPTLTSIAPTSGSALGGMAVTLTGNYFASGATVKIGGVAATNVAVVNATTITATTPANTPGTASVTVTNPDGDSATLAAAFTYLAYPPPTLSSIAPAAGTINGGTAVTLAGSNFLSGATVKFGTVAATNVVVVNSGQITAVTPANSAGAVNVTVTNPDAQFSTLNSAYTYNRPPVLISASPSVGSTNGGTSVTLSGSNFLTGATVTFNTSAATNVAVTNSTTITAKAPANPAGPVNVTVTNPDGQSATLVGIATPLTNAGFELGAPGWAWNGNSGSYAIVTNSSQAHGGNNFLQLTSQTGNHPSYNALLSGTSQYLAVNPGDIITYGGWVSRLSGDGQAHWALQVLDSNKANAVYVSTPNATAGTWTLFQQTYTVPSGKAYVRFYAEVYGNTTTAQVNFDDAILQQQVANAAFTYDPPPTVTSIAPNSGVPSGGAAVTITGTNFFAGAAVIIGGVAATNVSVVNGTTITATTPAHSSGTVNVAVTNADGDTGTLSAGYTYILYPPPSLTGVSPSGGSTNGGTAVTLTGSSFLTGATVKFGSTAAINAVVVNSGTITAFTPAGAAGTVTATVTNPDGQSGVLGSAFTYALPPTLTSVSPVIGPVSGGTSVTLSGANFKSGATVTFGGVAATNVVVVSSTMLTVTAPNNALGTATVVVTNPDGQTSALQPVGNPGFEMGNAGWSFNGSGSESIVTSSSQAHSGNNFAQLKSNAGNHPTFYPFFTGVNSTYLPVNPGDVITFGGWVSRVGGDGSARWSLQVSDVNKQNPVYYSTPNVTANAWTFNQQTLVIPSNGQYVRFYAEIYNNSVTATAYFDDALFLRTTPGQVFTYITNPTLGWIGPISGPANTPTSVYISGANFVPGATVSFGGAQATNVAVLNNATITATTPAAAAGSVAVTVTNPYSLASTSSLTYAFNPPPFINAVSPVTGPPGAATKVTVSGGNFLPGAKLTLGGIPALSVSTTPGSISAVTPAEGAGTVDVVVTNPDGQVATASGAFGYSQPAPSIASIAPASGSTNGGTLVVISGANFLASPTVTFGSTAGTVISVSSSAIYVTTPATSTSGAVNVAVVNSDTQSGSLSGGFTYVSPTPAPTIASLSSPSGTTAGGASIIITGTNFVSGATVSFGGVSASNISVTNSTTINATTPPHAPGTVNVTVTNPDGQSATLYGVIPLLPNAGFESGAADWVFAGTGSATVLNDPTNAETGNEYALVTGSGTFAAYYATDSSGSNQFFPVVSGDVISFGGSAYRLAGDGQANYTLSFYDANKNSLGSLHTTPNNAATPIWAHMLGSYTVPSNAAYVKLSAQIYSNTVSAQVRLDQAILTRTPAAGGYTYAGLNLPGAFTYHYDNMRTGQNVSETTLTPANVNTQTFGKKFSYSVDGWMHASPLYVANVMINGALHNVVYAATEHDSVYAFDADGNQTTPLWQVSFINPAAGITTIPPGDLAYQNTQPEYGIMATPVIDPVAGTIYLLARTKENGSYVQRLHALDITSGVERAHSPVTIQASVPGTGAGSSGGQVAYSSLYQNVRPALALVNGTVYFAAASIEDNGPYHGWVLGYDATSLNLVGIFNDTPNGSEGGIWHAGGGIAADASGNLFVQTGNGTFDGYLGGVDLGDSIIKLQLSSAGLNPVDYFTPWNQLTLDSQDLDIAAGAPILLPDQPGPHIHEMLGGGKTGTLYLLDRDAMGGYNAAGDSQIVQELPNALTQTTNTLDAGLWSTPTYWNNLIFIVGRADVLKVWGLQNGLLVGPLYTNQTTYLYSGSVMSSNGTYNPILWVVQSGGRNLLQALNPYNPMQEYYDTDQAAGARDLPGGITKFVVPLVINGKVYVSTQTELDVYGLL